MSTVLIILAALVIYAAFTLVKPNRRCPKCNGWGQKTGRRRPKACRKCQGTGTTFWPAARLVHRGVALAMRQLRERKEQGE